MASRIVVFGATGYTGRLVAERLVAQGARPVLAGRDEARVAQLADRLGGLEHVRADAMRQNSVFELVGSGDVLVSTVGPFAKWGAPAVRAAVAAGATYLDSTGEAEFIRRVFEEFGPPARRSGAALLTAMGYDFVPGALAGALALEAAGPRRGEASSGDEASGRGRATRVDVGYYALGGMVTSLSAGTRETLVGVTLSDAHAFRGGRVQAVRSAERVRSFTVAGRRREAISVGGAEHYGLPAAYPELREVNVYLGWFGPLARPLQAGALIGEYVTRLPLARATMRFWGERAAGLLSGPEPGTTPGGSSWIAAEAYAPDGTQLSEVHLSGVDGYEFTASFMAWAARHPVNGTGALGPVEAYGLEALEAGCREAGLERVR
jgi:saccharopine dehydrogenase-like protein